MNMMEGKDDAISRRAAIDAEMDEFKRVPTTAIRAKKRLESLPAAQPKRPQGHWIDDAKTYYEMLIKKGLSVDEYTPYFTDDIACSECLAKYSVIDNETQFFKHCPNCGARMENGGKAE